MSNLPGYENLVDSTIFGRPDPFSQPDKENVNILAFIRYTTPSFDEVADTVMETAKTILETQIKKRKIARDPETLEELLILMPDPALKSLLKAKKQLESQIKFYSQPYILWTYGVLPKVLIDTGELIGSRSDPSWYGRMFLQHSLLKQNLGTRWNVWIRMGRGLPEYQDFVTVLANPFVPEIQHDIKISGPDYNIYQGLNTLQYVHPFLKQKNTSRFFDNSKKMKDMYCKAMVFKFHEGWNKEQG